MPTTTPPLRRHPALASTPRAVFNPDGVGKVRGYPSTPEAFADRCTLLRENSARARASGKATRLNVPNGWRGRRAEVERLRQEAEVEAGRIVRILFNSATPEERLPLDADTARTDDQRAELAMTGLLAFALSPTYPTAIRLQAMRIALPFLKPMPTSGRGVELDGGLEWLRGLVVKAG